MHFSDFVGSSKKRLRDGGVSGLFQCRLRGVVRLFSYNYIGSVVDGVLWGSYYARVRIMRVGMARYIIGVRRRVLSGFFGGAF